MSKQTKQSKSADAKDISDAPKGKKKEKISAGASEEGDTGPRAKPKKALHAYLCYVTQNVKSVKTDEMAYKDAVKKCAENWNSLTDKEKVPYAAIAEEDQKRHGREMKEYNETGYFTTKDGIHSSKLEVKAKKKKLAQSGAVAKGKGYTTVEQPVVQPKKACVPFMFLVKERSAKIIKENGFKSAAAAIKVLGELWKMMSDEEKKPYFDLSAQDAKRRQKQLDELEKNGYFTTVDGKKSTDLPAKIKRVKANSKLAEQLGKRTSSDKTKTSNKHKVKVVMNPRKAPQKKEEADESEDDEDDDELEGGSEDDSSSESDLGEIHQEVIKAQKRGQKRQKVE